MAKATTYQHPNCDGVLAFDAQTGALSCAFCGGAFSECEITRVTTCSLPVWLAHCSWEGRQMFFEFAMDDEIPGFLYLIPFSILSAPFVIDMGLKDQMNTAVEAESDGLDYSTGGFVATESWNGPKFHFSRDKALADLQSR